MCVDVDLERIEQLSKVLDWAPDIHVSSSTCSPLAQMAGGGAFPLSSKLINQSCHLDGKKNSFSSILYLEQGLSFSWDILCFVSFGPLFQFGFTNASDQCLVQPPTL